jgi:hypothetical protein
LLFGLREYLFEGDGEMKRKMIFSCATMAIVVLLWGSIVCGNTVKIFYSDGVIQQGESYDRVEVYDTPPSHTTVNINGGYVGRSPDVDTGLYTYDASIVNISGGIVEYLHTHNSSTVNVCKEGRFGANFGDYTFELYDSSTVNVYEGGGFAGGSGARLTLYDSGILNISGGHVSLLLFTRDSSIVNLYGGDLFFGFDMFDESILNIYGGYVDTFLWNSTATPGALVNIYGYGFEYNTEGRWCCLEEDCWWESKLIGYTFDGKPFTYWGIPDPTTHPNINLIPEPGTFFLLGAGGLLLIRKRRCGVYEKSRERI